MGGHWLSTSAVLARLADWINDDGAMTELDIAFEVAQRLLNWTPSTVDHAFIENVEVVAVDGLVGLDIRWTQVTSDQGLRRFGLLTTVSELLDDRIDSEALDWATQALILAVQESKRRTSSEPVDTSAHRQGALLAAFADVVRWSVSSIWLTSELGFLEFSSPSSRTCFVERRRPIAERRPVANCFGRRRSRGARQSR
jgi:hypothetical protein